MESSNTGTSTASPGMHGQQHMGRGQNFNQQEPNALMRQGQQMPMPQGNQQTPPQLQNNAVYQDVMRMIGRGG